MSGHEPITYSYYCRKELAVLSDVRNMGEEVRKGHGGNSQVIILIPKVMIIGH